MNTSAVIGADEPPYRERHPRQREVPEKYFDCFTPSLRRALSMIKANR
jgi:hypothetical protein